MRTCDDIGQVETLFQSDLPKLVDSVDDATCKIIVHLAVIFLHTRGSRAERNHFAALGRTHRLEDHHEVETASVHWTTTDNDKDSGNIKLIAWQTVPDDRKRPQTVDKDKRLTDGCLGRITTDGEVQECLICLNFLFGVDPVVCLPCTHVYHQHCLETWKMSGRTNAKTCPACREPYKGKQGHEGRFEWSGIQL